MADEQGVFLYPGITGQLSASMTLTAGITPSVTTVTVPYEPTLPTRLQRIGTAEWWFGDTLVRSFPQSVIGDVRAGDSGGQRTWEIYIYDRRWMWEGGFIAGEYNVRRGRGIVGVKKTPRQLAELCLEAMEEPSYDLSELPNDDLPYRDWNAVETPAKALAELCDLYACEIVLMADNSIKIVKNGDGAFLPASNGPFPQLNFQPSFDPAELPKELKLVAGDTLWQNDFPVVAVGFEKSDPESTSEDEGEMKRINELSYKPAGVEWDEITDFEDYIDDKDERELAEQHIGRTFAIDVARFLSDPAPPTDPEEEYELPDNPQVPGALVPITDATQFIIQDFLVETEGSALQKRPKRAFVYGEFFGGQPLGELTGELDEEDPEYEPFDRYKYKGSFSIDSDRGLVHFSERISSWEGAPASRVFAAARLYLRCAFKIRDKDTRAIQRYAYTIPVDPTSPMLPVAKTREDFQLENLRTSKVFATPTWTDNTAAVDNQARFYLQQELRAYEPREGTSASYAGFIAIDIDGAIRQVSYSIDSSGLSTSTVNRHYEDIEVAQTYEEAKFRRKLSLVREKFDSSRTEPGEARFKPVSEV